MRRLAPLLACATLLACAGPARADFGLHGLGSSFTDAAEAPQVLAGSHPASATTDFSLNTRIDPKTAFEVIDGDLRDLHVALPAGFAGNATVAPTCEMADFMTVVSTGNGQGRATACSANTVLGYLEVVVAGGVGVTGTELDPLYNLAPNDGEAAKLGVLIAEEPQLIDVTVSPEPPFDLVASITDTTQVVEVRGSETRVWGDPASPAHDKERGICGTTDLDHDGNPFNDDSCPSGLPEQAYLRMPTSCAGPLATTFSARSWWSGDPQNPDPVPAGFAQTVQGPAMEGCAALGFDPLPAAAPTTDLASSPSGFDFSIHVEDPGLLDPTARGASDLKRAVVTLPPGLTVNAAAAGGLAACTQAQLAEETPDSPFGAGCPAASRVASVDVTSPLLSEHLQGSVFLAEPYANPLGTLLAGYLVIKQPERGVIVRLAGKIEADEETGRLTASFDQNPQLPFSDLAVHFFGGPRAPLSTPDACGDYEVSTELDPWSGSAPQVSAQPFAISQAPGGACPGDASGLPDSPSFDAGVESPIAKSFSPFVLHLRRADGSQRFSALQVSPPQGLIAKLAGTPPCPDAALAAAAARSGRDEQASPSCPAASRVGSAYAAAGSGPDPYWAAGELYLAGPYKGAPLSFAAITPAVAGPFDLGTVVVRAPVRIDPVTARVSTTTDPLPTLLKGIPLDIRALDIAIDKPDFTRTGTSCDPAAVEGLLTTTLGQSAPLSSRYQLGECSRLPFKPKMKLFLRGDTERAGHPRLTVVLTTRPQDADIASLQLALPHSEFLDQSHIGTVCTRVQFAADACPGKAVYGHARVTTPILDYPLAGNVLLRSSDNLLPDLVPDLRGPASQPLRIESAGRTDSIHGGIRNTFDFIPDAPFTKLVTRLQGGAKGLLQNSTDICAHTYRATVRYSAHNGRTYVEHPELRASCKTQGSKHHHRAHGRRGAGAAGKAH